MKRLLLLIIIAGSLLAKSTDLSLSVKDAHYHIGDRIKVDLAIKGSENQMFVLPDITAYLQNVMVLDIQKEESVKKHQKQIDLQFEITAFDTGFVHIPAMPVIRTDSTGFGKPDTIFTPEKYIYIYTMLDSTASPIAMTPPVPLGLMTWWEILIALLLLSASIVLVYMAIKYRSKKKDTIEEFWESPQEKAEHYLLELEKKHYPEKERWKAFYLELTYIARDYFENIYFIHLKELTTSELIPALNEHVPSDYQTRLRDLFQFADLVKFAKGLASKEQCYQHFQLIMEIIKKEEGSGNKEESMDQIP
jgi:hypothetical protein